MALGLFAYRKGATLLHKTPALIKITLLIALCVVTFGGKNAQTLSEALSKPVLIRLGSCFLASIFFFVLGGCNFKSFKSLRWLIFVCSFVTLFKMISIPLTKSAVLDGLASGLLYSIRFFITAFAAQTIYETTSQIQIKEGLESAQNVISVPLPFIKKLNPALVISLAIGFIPDVFRCWEKVRLACRARTPQKQGLIQTVKNLYAELSAVISCLISLAQNKRLAILNREI